MSPDKKYPEVNVWSVSWGICMAILFSAAAAYLGLKVGQVFEAAIPIAIIAVGVSSAAKRKHALGENVIIQSIGASYRGWCHLYPTRPLYLAGKLSTGSGRHFCPSIHQLTAGRCIGHPVPHSLPQILCQRHARQVSFPRSHSYHTGACVGRERWQPGQAAAGRRSDRRSVRLHRGYLRLVERKLYYPLLLVGRNAGREDQAGVQSERRRSRIGFGLYRRLKICCYYLLRLTGRVVDHHSWHVTHLG